MIKHNSFTKTIAVLLATVLMLGMCEPQFHVHAKGADEILTLEEELPEEYMQFPEDEMSPFMGETLFEEDPWDDSVDLPWDEVSIEDPEVTDEEDVLDPEFITEQEEPFREEILLPEIEPFEEEGQMPQESNTDDDALSGSVGSITWSLSDGTLTLSGFGEIPSRDSGEKPWHSLTYTKLIVEDGITSVGYGGLYCSAAKTPVEFLFPSSLAHISAFAFSGHVSGCSVVFSSTDMPELDADAFTDVQGLTVYYPCSWKNFDPSQYSLISVDLIHSFDQNHVCINSDCSCTHESQKVIPQVDETCTSDGMTEGSVCNSCGRVLMEPTVIPAHHMWESDFTVDTAGSCTADGQKSIHCTRCSEVKDITVIPAHGHTPGDWVAEGEVHTRYCEAEDCGTLLNCEDHSFEAGVCTVCAAGMTASFPDGKQFVSFSNAWTYAAQTGLVMLLEADAESDGGLMTGNVAINLNGKSLTFSEDAVLTGNVSIADGTMIASDLNVNNLNVSDCRIQCDYLTVIGLISGNADITASNIIMRKSGESDDPAPVTPQLPDVDLLAPLAAASAVNSCGNLTAEGEIICENNLVCGTVSCEYLYVLGSVECGDIEAFEIAAIKGLKAGNIICDSLASGKGLQADDVYAGMSFVVSGNAACGDLYSGECVYVNGDLTCGNLTTNDLMCYSNLVCEDLEIGYSAAIKYNLTCKVLTHNGPYDSQNPVRFSVSGTKVTAEEIINNGEMRFNELTIDCPRVTNNNVMIVNGAAFAADCIYSNTADGTLKLGGKVVIPALYDDGLITIYSSPALAAGSSITLLAPDSVSCVNPWNVKVTRASNDNVVYFHAVNSVGNLNVKFLKTGTVQVYADHTAVTDQAVDPTCTESGLTEGSHCSVCNEVFIAQEEIPAKGHVFNEDAVCTVCGSEHEHPESVVVSEAVEATCEESGLTEGKYCSVCGIVFVTSKEIPAKGHTAVIDPAEKPTCTMPGKTEGSHCSVCGKVLAAQSVVAALGHTEVIDPAQEATYTSTGLTEGKHCSVCNEVLIAQKVVPVKKNGTPVLVSAVNASNGITVRWNAVSGAEKYRVFYKVQNGSWIKAADVTGTSYTVTGLDYDCSYWFTVRCITADGKTYTSEYDKAGLNCTYTYAPILVSLTNTVNGVTVKWNPLQGAEKYRVFYKTDNGTWTKAGDTTGTSYTVTGLNINWSYWFTVRGITADGKSYTSGYDKNGLNCRYTNAPVLVSASNAVNGVTVKWNMLPGAAKYRVFYKTNNGSWTKAGDTTGTSYTVTGLNTNWNYLFTVRCISDDGKSYTSTYDTSGLSICYQGTPVLKTVSNASNGVTVTWNTLQGATKYRVFYKTNNGSWTKAGDTAGTSYTVTGLNTNWSYWFTVRAISEDGKSYTSTYDKTGLNIRYQGIPALKAVSNTANGVNVTWNALQGASKYRVFYKTTNGSWTKAGDTTGTSYTVSGLNTNWNYWFTVRAISDDGKSYTSTYNTAGLNILYMGKPELVSASSVSTGVTLKWNPLQGASAYRVFYKTNNGSWTKVADTSQTSYTITGLTMNWNYRFTVRAVSTDGKNYTSNYDNPGLSCVYTGAKMNLPAPKLVYAAGGTKSAVVRWNAVEGAESYRIFRKSSTGWITVGNTTGTTATISGLTSGAEYTFTVRCTTFDGKTYTSTYDSTGITCKAR